MASEKALASLNPNSSSSPSLKERDTLSLYMQEAARFPLLSHSEERALAERIYNDKDIRAAQILAQSNLRFVIKIAMEYARYANRTLDLIQEGNLGLIHAIREFNPYKDVRLTTYAVWWIRSYIQDYLLRNWSVVRIGTTKAQKKLFYRLKQVQEELQRQGITPHVKAIAHQLQVPEKDVETMTQRLSGRDVSMGAPLSGTGNDGESRTLDFENRIADTGALASDVLANQEQSELFKKALEEFQDELNERELIIFKERLMSEKSPTLQDLGDRFGLTKERTRQIEEAIKNKLRKFLAEYYPDISVG